MALAINAQHAQSWGNRSVWVAAGASAVFTAGAPIIMGLYLSGVILPEKMTAVVLWWGALCLLDVLIQAAPLFFRGHIQGMAMELDTWTSRAPMVGFAVAFLLGVFSSTPLGLAGGIFLLEGFLVALAELGLLEISKNIP